MSTFNNCLSSHTHCKLADRPTVPYCLYSLPSPFTFSALSFPFALSAKNSSIFTSTRFLLPICLVNEHFLSLSLPFLPIMSPLFFTLLFFPNSLKACSYSIFHLSPLPSSRSSDSSFPVSSYFPFSRLPPLSLLRIWEFSSASFFTFVFLCLFPQFNSHTNYFFSFISLLIPLTFNTSSSFPYSILKHFFSYL